ncbi:PREDICTED: enhancer of mRNA-decapping protein 3 [Eufriesea mexicana]|uniref:enhancer of mRNA-decapping protein 3 n=1 Tax=Eufriesea mexicana TaxID=516756 RepID=UPI00083BFA32|nr:PREDICTED: enhancer of mRNA-decapping protein 3 [Eufriesea mexicana]
MSEKFVGCIVSVKCIEEVGTYQGEIVDLNKDCLILATAFCNGIPHASPIVTLGVKDILDVEFISINDRESDIYDAILSYNNITVKRPIAKRVGRSISESISSPVQSTSSQTPINSRKLNNISQSNIEQSTNGKISLPESIDKPIQKKLGSKQRNLGRNEDTFGTSIEQSLNQDFDFEKNLALFDKEAVWQKIDSVKSKKQKQGLNKSYRPDENIIVSEPTVFRQIMVPCAGGIEYVTDNGLIIPSITLNLHRQLIGAADRLGISWERRVELLGRAGTEIILQLLGGSHRLNPNNAHQWPTVIALCGPHRSGAAGVNCARQLSSYGIKTIVFVENSEDVFLLQELSLYKLTGNKVETKLKNLPSVVDLILVALCDENSPRMITPIAKWANSNRAPILAIDPPATGTPGILSKYSLLGGLPLSHSMDNGKLYLCNLALPNEVYADVGITYRSPFGSKFVIPLHSNNS